MQVSDDVRKCVVFVGYRMADGTYRFAGSAFFLGKDESKEDPRRVETVYLVTAKHVIDGIRAKGLEKVMIRYNAEDGSSQWAESQTTEWFSHPTDRSIDVAVVRAGVSPGWDHLVVPYSIAMTPERMKEQNIGCGDEVFVTGLFRHHHGGDRNVPIVRVGNLSCATEEKVNTRHFGDMAAYLIEARSIGGLSGSPAFVHMGLTRLVDNQIRFAQRHPTVLFLGLVHGHYDTDSSRIDGANPDDADALTVERVNTGIAIVVPFRRIAETIDACEAAKAEAVTGAGGLAAAAKPHGMLPG